MSVGLIDSASLYKLDKLTHRAFRKRILDYSSPSITGGLCLTYDAGAKPGMVPVCGPGCK